MRTKRIIQGLLFSWAVITAGQAFGQASVPGNSGGPTDYLGWDNSNPFPLEIRHDGNQPIDWYTNAIQRMSLLPDATYTIGGFPAQVKNGALLLSPSVANFYGSAPGPFTGLHIHDGSTFVQQSGYRSNMGNGITLTGNGDQMYMGQLSHGYDYTDAAVVWSDNPGSWLSDRLTFNFTSSYNSSATSGNDSFRGLQTLLVQPDVSGDEAYIGLGDFDAVGATPSERLDVLNGRVRIQQLPTDPIASTLTKFLVVEDTPGPDFGVVKWRNVPPGTGGGCEWTLLGAPGSNSNVATAYNGNPGCPQGDKSVGIGTNSLFGLNSGKLTVNSKVHTEGGPPNGIWVDVKSHNGGASGITAMISPEGNGIGQLTGIDGRATNGSIGNYGVSGSASLTGVSSPTNFGVFGHGVVRSAGQATHNRGGSFIAELTEGGTVQNNTGTWSEAWGGLKATGVYALAKDLYGQTQATIGVNAVAQNSTISNTGVRGQSNTTNLGVGLNYGLYGLASNGATNYGVYAGLSGLRATPYGAVGPKREPRMDTDPHG